MRPETFFTWRALTKNTVKPRESNNSNSGIPLFVPITVMLELEWVLRSRYRFDKATVLGAFNALLETQELEFQDEAALERALHLYRLAAADFADCLHTGICGQVGRVPLVTFDVRAARLPNVEILQT